MITVLDMTSFYLGNIVLAVPIGSAIASSSLATEWVKGKTVDEALRIKNTDIAKELCLPPIKLHCSMLAEDALKAALSDYRLKRQKSEETNENQTCK